MDIKNTHPNTSSAVTVDAIIVGAGMVGASLALGLANALPKLRIALIDAAPEAEALPQGEFDARVVALTRASQHWLTELDVWEWVKQERVCPYSQMHVWDADGTGEVTFDCDSLHQPNLGHIVENRRLVYGLQQAFLQKVKQGNRLLHWQQGQSVTQLIHHCDADKNHLRGVLLVSGQTVFAPLIIAADGVHSKIRTLAAMPVKEQPCFQKAIVTNVTTEKNHQNTAWQRFLATGPLAFLPLADEYQCSIVWSLDDNEADKVLRLEDEAFKLALERAFESKLGKITQASPRAAFPLVQRHAPSYGEAGLVMVGDAAHNIHPLAGQGANLGLLDARVLCEELIRAYQRRLPFSDATIIRRYQRQRQYHNLLTLKAMSGFKSLFGNDHLPIRWIRNQGMNCLQKMPWVKAEIARQAMGL